MSHSKDLRTYPREFFMLGERFEGQKAALEVPFSTRRAAIAWRGRFNAFKAIVARTPLEQSPLPPGAHTALVGLRVRLLPSLPAVQEKLCMEQPAVLVIEHVDFTVESAGLRTLLAEQIGSTGGDPSIVAVSKEPQRVDPYQLKKDQEVGEQPDAMEALLAQQFGALLNSDALHCSLCEPAKQCWTGIGECEFKVD